MLKLFDPAGMEPYAGRWFNPRNGDETKRAARIPVANGQCPLPVRPDDEDWVLILRRDG